MKTFLWGLFFLVSTLQVTEAVPNRIPKALRAAFNQRVQESREFMRDFVNSSSAANAGVDFRMRRSQSLYRRNLIEAYNHINEIAPPWVNPPMGGTFSLADFRTQAYVMGAEPQMWKAFRYDSRGPAIIIKEGFRPPPTGTGDIFKHSFYVDSSKDFADMAAKNSGSIVSASSQRFNIAAMNLVPRGDARVPIFLYEFTEEGAKVPDFLEFGGDSECEIMFRSVAAKRIVNVTAVMPRGNLDFIAGPAVPIRDAVMNPNLMRIKQ